LHDTSGVRARRSGRTSLNARTQDCGVYGAASAVAKGRGHACPVINQETEARHPSSHSRYINIHVIVVRAKIEDGTDRKEEPIQQLIAGRRYISYVECHS